MPTGETPNQTPTGQTTTVEGTPSSPAIVENTRDAPRTASVTTADLQAQEAADNDSTAPPVPQTIDWAKVDVSTIPHDVVKEHASYKSVLSESITRRRDLTALKATIGDQSTTEPSGDNTDSTEGDNPPDNDNTDPPFLARFNALQESVTSLITLQLQQAQTQVRDGVLADANLPDEAAAFVRGDTAEEMTTQAKALQQLLAASLPDPSVSPGNPAALPKEGVGKRLKARMLGEDVVNVFDPALQRQKGGGAVTN